MTRTFVRRCGKIILTSIHRQPPTPVIARHGHAIQPSASQPESTQPLIDNLPGPSEGLPSETRLPSVHSHFLEEGANNATSARLSQLPDQGYSEARDTPSTGTLLLAAPAATSTIRSNTLRPRAMDVSEHLDPGEPDAAAQRYTISPTDLSSVTTQRPTAVARHEAAKEDPGE